MPCAASQLTPFRRDSLFFFGFFFFGDGDIFRGLLASWWWGGDSFRRSVLIPLQSKTLTEEESLAKGNCGSLGDAPDGGRLRRGSSKMKKASPACSRDGPKKDGPVSHRSDVVKNGDIRGL